MHWLTISADLPIVAVLPVLPASTGLVIILATSLLGLLGAAARFRPRELRRLAHVAWRQKPGLLVSGLLIGGLSYLAAIVPAWSRPAAGLSDWRSVTWPTFRGATDRTGHADRNSGPDRGGIRWASSPGYEFLSSPAIAGDQIIAIGNQGDTARIFSWDATSGELRWSFSPPGYRASLSSAVIADGMLVCGEGLHWTPNSRMFCITLADGQPPNQVLDFTTAGHVECTPILFGGRMYFGAGDDGIYCLERNPDNTPGLQAVWQAPGTDFPDCETSLVVDGGRVYAGLGDGGEALCVLDADSGREIARLKLPHPAFSPPAIANGKLYVGSGRANYVSREANSPGDVRCIDLATLTTEWFVTTPASVLAAVVVSHGEIFFSTVDGELIAVDERGQVSRRWQARARMLTAPAVTDRHVYCVSCDGMLTALDRNFQRIWSERIGAPGNYVSSPVVFRGSIYVGTPADGFVRVGEPTAQPASEIWPGALGGPGRAGSVSDTPLPSRVSVAWNLPGPTPEQVADVSAAPAVCGTDLFVPMANDEWFGLVCAEDRQAASPVVRWSWTAPAPIHVSPVVTGSVVWCLSGVPGGAGELVAIDRRTGRVCWRRQVPFVSLSISADEEAAVVVGENGWLTRYDESGNLSWRVSLGSIEMPAHIHGEIIVVATQSPDQLVMLDRLTGNVLWQISLPHPPQGSPVIRDDRVLIPTLTGIEFRSLISGELQRVLPGEFSDGCVYVDRDRFVAKTRNSTLIIASAIASRDTPRTFPVASNSGILVASNAVVYAADERQLLMQQFDGSSEPSPWFTTGANERLGNLLIHRDQRVYLSVVGRGLVCLASPGSY